MTVIWLHERAPARKAAGEAEPNGSPSAVDYALRYLKEEADEMGERYLSHLMDMASLDTQPFRGEGDFQGALEESADSRLKGIADCLGSLESVTSGSERDVRSAYIRWAKEAARKKAGLE